MSSSSGSVTVHALGDNLNGHASMAVTASGHTSHVIEGRESQSGWILQLDLSG